MKCPKCNKEVSELEEKCTSCGLDFEEYENQLETEENKEFERNQNIIFKISNGHSINRLYNRRNSFME